MEKLIRAFTTLVSRPSPSGEPKELQVDLDSAPPAIAELAQAMATHPYHVNLGEFRMYHSGSFVKSLAPTIDMSCENGEIELDWPRQHGGPGGSAFDPDQTLELGADGGGMSYFGVSWSGGTLSIVVVEFDDPVEENLIQHFTSPAAFFEFLAGKADGDDPPEDVAVLIAAC